MVPGQVAASCLWSPSSSTPKAVQGDRLAMHKLAIRSSDVARSGRGRTGRAITSGGVSFQHNMPFWRISCHADLEALRHALELEYL